MAKYLDACLIEATAYSGCAFDTVYIGGGTPSSMGGDLLGDFIRKLLGRVNYKGKEFTVEVNPESISEELCVALEPVSRVSMGIQSFSDKVLRFLGRAHNREKAIAAVELLQKELPQKDLSLDLIYDIPSITWAEIKDSAERLVSFKPSHVSAYSYTDETGWLAENNDDPFQTEELVTLFEQAGYLRYEVSNYARPGKESIHNSAYWMGMPYIGIGAGAHSMDETVGRRRWSHNGDLKHYLSDPLGKDDLQALTTGEALLEDIIFGLRLREGINLLDIQKKYSNIPDTLLLEIEKLKDDGLLEGETELRATKRGFLLLDTIMARLW